MFNGKGCSSRLRLRHTSHNGRAKDGSLSNADGMLAVGRLVGRRVAWTQSLALAAHYSGNRLGEWPMDRDKLAPCGWNSQRLCGLLLLPSAGWTQGPRVGRAAVGVPRNRWSIAASGGRLADPTVLTTGSRAGIHHNPMLGPADQKFLYGHIWVTISLVFRHPCRHTLDLPLWV